MRIKLSLVEALVAEDEISEELSHEGLADYSASLDALRQAESQISTLKTHLKLFMSGHTDPTVLKKFVAKVHTDLLNPLNKLSSELHA